MRLKTRERRWRGVIVLMSFTDGIRRLLGPTRAHILNSLRRSSQTVNELADEVGLTDNAVRSHLAALERDGLVSQQTVRRGIGKPAYVYDATSEADALLAKAYAPVLAELLGVLTDELGPDAAAKLLRQAGDRVARGRATEGAGTRARIGTAVQVLTELGALVHVEESEGTITIVGHSCPLAAVVPDHPEACQVAEALLTSIVGAPVREHCDKSARPHCRFETAMPA